MENSSYIRKLRTIHEVLLDYLYNQQIDEQNFKELIENRLLLKDFLYLISRISANHHTYPDLFIKIKQILLGFKEKIKANFTNLEIFNIFEKDKKLLLFLFDEKVLIPDRTLFNIISNYKHEKLNYKIFFYPEFESFFDKSIIQETTSLFNEKRRKFENENYICQLIRYDSIDDFIIFVNKNNISLNTNIKNSLYETNPLLIDKNVSLIEYSAFYGSLQIFNYLRFNGVELESSLWVYAIHGKNPELFHLLEENHVELNDEVKKQCLKESIKCHHNEFTKYIQDNFFNTTIDESEYLVYNLKHHNYLGLPDDIIEKSELFFYFCKYDYFFIVNYLLNNKEIDVNLVHVKEVADKNWEYKEIYKRIYGKYSIISDLIDHYKEENTSLCVSIKKNHKEIVQILLQQKNINVNQKFSAKHELYAIGPNYTEENKTPLFIAAENEQLEIVELLLKNKNININGESLCTTFSEELEGQLIGNKTPLQIAIEKQNIELIMCLLNQENIFINVLIQMSLDKTFYYKKTLLHIAIEKENEKIVELLLSNNIDQSVDYNVTKFNRVFDGHSYNRNIEIKTSLQLAIQHENIKIVELLLKNEKNINKLDLEAKMYDTENETTRAALHIATENESLDIVKLLLSVKNIDVNLQACYKQYEQSKKANITQNKTPLFIAVEKNNERLVKLFLNKKGIDIDVKLKENVYSYNYINNNSIKSALDLAIQNGNKKIIRLLIKKGAKQTSDFNDAFQIHNYKFINS